MKLPGHENLTAVVVGTITDDVRILKIPKLKVRPDNESHETMSQSLCVQGLSVHTSVLRISQVLQENIIVSFSYFHFLRLKQKMDSLLFLIKKFNNNKKAGYNDIAYIIYLQKQDEAWHAPHTVLYTDYGLIHYRTLSKHCGLKINKRKKALIWGNRQRF